MGKIPMDKLLHRNSGKFELIFHTNSTSIDLVKIYFSVLKLVNPNLSDLLHKNIL